MASVVYNIDPNGDLVVVLKDPNTYWVVPEVSVRENPVGSQAGHLLRDTTDVDTPKMPSGLGDSVEAPTEVRFRVSSRHLTLASVVFDKMLNGPWKESASVSTRSSPKDGYTTAPEDDVQDSKDMDEPGPPVDPSTPSPPLIREVSAEGWNAQALLTVLKVIHGQCSGISRDVSLTFIAQVAIIVNYYQCAESVSFATELLYYPKYKKPEVYNKKAIMWLFIAWSFSWPAVFQDTAHQVLQRGQGLSYVTTHDLDVDGILEQLDKKRKSTLDLLRQGLEDIKQKLSEGKLGCHHKCRSMMLGSLMLEKSFHPDLPLGGKDDYSLSLCRFVYIVNNFRPIDWCPDRYTSAHSCSPKQSMQPVINKITKDLMVKLSDFQ